MTPGNEATNESAATPVDEAAWREAIRLRALAALERKPPSRVRRWYIAALVVALLVHLAGWIELRDAMRTPTLGDETTVQVILLDAPPSAPPLSVPPPRHTQGSVPLRLGNRPAASTAVIAAAPTAVPNAASTKPRIFNRDGTVRLPPPPALSPLEAGLARGRELLARGHNLIHCRRSRFDNSPTPEQAGIMAGNDARMAHLIMGNPLDPLNDVGAQQGFDAASEHAEAKRAMQEHACDYLSE